MNSNSFLIKGWAITLVSALFALAAKDTNINYVFVTYIGIPIFWGLDAYYLSQERKFRSLYDEVRLKAEVNIDFSMVSENNDEEKISWYTTIFSKTVWPIYVTIIIITICAIYFFPK
jgi:hypothetical protein